MIIKYKVFIKIVKGLESEVGVCMSHCRKYLRSLVCFCVCAFKVQGIVKYIRAWGA